MRLKIKTGEVSLNRLIISIILMISLFLVSGIEGCPAEPEEKVIPGLSMEFVGNAPPNTITTEQKIPIYVDIKNGGGVHVGMGDAVFFLSNVGDKFDGVVEKLSNKKFLDKGIGMERLKFATAAQSNLELENPFMPILTLTGCYDYETIAQVKACIASEESNICSITGEKVTETSNSLAPIQITSFTEKIEGNRLTIAFIIENIGVNPDKPGEVYLKDANCDLIHEKEISETLKIRNINVEIKVGKGTEDFTCNLQDGVAIISSSTGKAKVECVKTLAGEDYETMFKINLKYKYYDSIGTAITILPV